MKSAPPVYKRILIALVITISLGALMHSSAQPNPNCDPTELKKQIKEAQEKETELKKEVQDRQAPLVAEEADMKKALKSLASELPSAKLDGNITSTFDVDRAIQKYQAALEAYNGAIDHFMDTVTKENYDKARADLVAAELPRKKARAELLAMADAAIQFEKKQQEDREKGFQAAAAGQPPAPKKAELQTLRPKKDQPTPDSGKRPRVLEDLEGTEKSKTKLERLQEARDFFAAEEANYDEASGEFASAYSDYRKAFARKAELQTQLQKMEDDCAEKPKIDSCLIGTWECVHYTENNKRFTGGGTGFRVTFKNDGTEIVDYSSMQPIRFAGNDILSFEGKASAKISTNRGVAKIEKMLDAGASFHFVVRATGTDWKPKIPGLGAGGLGEAKGNGTYKCTEDTLEYQISGARDLHPTGTAKLHRIKE